MAPLEAELEAAATGPERVSLDREAVDTLRGLGELAGVRKEAARRTERGLPRVRARRLKVEIPWGRARVEGLE